jgi:hypothetical protein
VVKTQNKGGKKEEESVESWRALQSSDEELLGQWFVGVKLDVVEGRVDAGQRL